MVATGWDGGAGDSEQGSVAHPPTVTPGDLEWLSASAGGGQRCLHNSQEEETVPDSHPQLSGEGGYFCLP